MKRAIGSHAARRLPEPAAMLPKRNAVAARVVVRQCEMRMGRVSAVRKPDALPNRALLRTRAVRVSAGGLVDTSFDFQDGPAEAGHYVRSTSINVRASSCGKRDLRG